MVSRNQTLALALAAAALSLVLLFLWIPFDVQTGIVERVRRRSVIGDALAPTVAGMFILLGAISLAFRHKHEKTSGMSAENVRFLASLIGVGLIGLLLMRWAGPVVATLFGHEYRLLRTSVPWKYIGFVLGGWTMVFGLIVLAERRLSRRAVLFALGAVALLIAAYDLPFEDLLLPPNGDY